MFMLVLAGFVLLMIVFTFFDLLGDILRNHIALATVGDYLLNLTPSMLYQIAPLAVLIAVLVTFGVLNRNSEIIAMKATGISLYRLVVPIVSIAAILAVSLFLFDQYYLPQANRRQEALRNVIKGRPPQTYLHPEQKWIFGQAAPGEPGRIFYYQFFDPDRNEFANLSVFEFNPSTFALTRRIFAKRAVWDADTDYLAFRERLGARHPGRQRDGVPRHSCKTTFPEIHDDAGLLQEGRPAVAGDELRPARPLHPRPAPERIRHHAAARGAVAQASYPLIAVVMACWPFPLRFPWAGAARSPASPWPSPWRSPTGWSTACSAPWAT